MLYGGKRQSTARRVYMARALLQGSLMLGLLAGMPAAGLRAAEPAAGPGAATQMAPRAFDIPAQPLADALTAFGIQSGLQVSVDTALVGGLRSTAIRGAQTPDQALRALLAGTGMGWRLSSANTVVIERAPAPATSEHSAAPTVPAGPIVLDAITVAGERMERSLMQTASSVAVRDAKTLEQRPDLAGTNAVTEDVANVVTIEPGNYAPTVRGIDGSGPATGANAFFAGTRPRLTMQIDGRPTSFNEMIFGDGSLWDVEQVEVFRGPQSTVQGRNSIAGAIVVKTKDPTYTPEGKARAIIGNMDSRQYSGMISGPIIEDQMALRIAVDRATSSSKLAFSGYAGEDDPEDYQSTTLRAKVLIEPRKLAGLRTMLTLNHTDYEGPQGEYVKRPFANDATPQSVNVATFNPRTTSGIIETTWEMNDALTLENHLTVTDLSIRRHAPANQGNLKIDGQEAMLEPRLNFTGLDQRLRGFGGYYGLRAKQDEYIDLLGGNSFADRTRTDAMFGEATLAVTDSVDVTAGARVEQEQRRRVGGSGNYTIDFDESYRTFLPKLGVAWQATPALTVGSTVSRGYNGGGAGLTWSSPYVSYTYKPEYVWNYETYARTELLGGRLRLTGNLFYADYQNLQLPFTLGANSTVIRNAREAVTYGSELGAQWQASDTLKLHGEIGLLQTEVTEYGGSGIEGNDLPHSPAMTGTLGASYSPWEGVELGADARYSEAYYSDAGNTPRGKTDPYWVVNARAAYDFGGPRVFAYVKNLFNTETPVDIGLGTVASSDYATMLRSRSFGVGVEMSF